MSHDINAMVFAGETPWHGLGTRLPANGTYEEIRDAAGFYRVREEPITRPGGFVVPDHKLIVRDDATADYIATVGKGYGVVQFDELAEAGVIAAGGVKAIWHTAGTLGKRGERGWLLLELPGVVRVINDKSETRKYVLLTTSHDGSLACYLMNCATRVVCKNTLGVALREADGARWRFRHTKNAAANLKQAAVAFRNMVEHFDQYEQLANVLARRSYTEAMHKEVIDALLPLPTQQELDAGKKLSPTLVDDRKSVAALFETFTGNEGLRGTAWGAFQAWTEHVDHNKYAMELNKKKHWGTKLNGLAFGGGALLKAKAWEAILAQSHITEADFAQPVAA